MIEIDFLTIDDVLLIHNEIITRYEGCSGIRDKGLLESAIIQPQVAYHYEELSDLFQLAAILGYHIIKNHSFVDGNKRTGILSALLFLERNGFTLDASDEQLYTLTLSIAESKITKEEIAAFFRRTAKPHQQA